MQVQDARPVWYVSHERQVIGHDLLGLSDVSFLFSGFLGHVDGIGPLSNRGRRGSSQYNCID